MIVTWIYLVLKPRSITIIQCYVKEKDSRKSISFHFYGCCFMSQRYSSSKNICPSGRVWLYRRSTQVFRLYLQDQRMWHGANSRSWQGRYNCESSNGHTRWPCPAETGEKSTPRCKSWEFLSRFQAYGPVLLPIDNMSGKTPGDNLKKISNYLEQEGAVIIFPAGETTDNKKMYLYHLFDWS